MSGFWGEAEILNGLFEAILRRSVLVSYDGKSEITIKPQKRKIIRGR